MAAFRYGDLTWLEIRDAIARQPVVLLPFGTVEDHGPHFCLLDDRVDALGEKDNAKAATLTALLRAHGAQEIQVAAKDTQLNAQQLNVIAQRQASLKEDPYQGWSLLMIAAWRGQEQIIAGLLRQTTDLDQQDEEGYTALMRAAWQGHVKIVQQLLERGASVDAQQSQQKTALGIAAEQGQIDVVRLLLKHKADLNHSAKDDATPLLLALRAQYAEIAHLLLDIGADSNRSDGEGATPVIMVTRSNDVDLLRTHWLGPLTLKGDFFSRGDRHFRNGLP